MALAAITILVPGAVAFACRGMVEPAPTEGPGVPGREMQGLNVAGGDAHREATAAGGEGQEDSTKPWTLKIHSPRERYYLGEPIVLAVSLVNRSGKTQQVRELIGPEYGFLIVRVLKPGADSEVQLFPARPKGGRGKLPKPMGPGQRLTAFLPLYLDREGWFLGRPGSYRIRAELNLETVAVTSEPVTIEIAKTGTEVEEMAAKLMMDAEAARFLLSEGREGQEGGRKKLALLATEHGTSRLAPYALLGLGYHWNRKADRSKQPNDYERAVKELSSATKALPDPILAAKGTVALSRCLKQLGRHEEATRAVEEFTADHPEAGKLSWLTEYIEKAAGLKR